MCPGCTPICRAAAGTVMAALFTSVISVPIYLFLNQFFFFFFFCGFQFRFLCSLCLTVYILYGVVGPVTHLNCSAPHPVTMAVSLGPSGTDGIKLWRVVRLKMSVYPPLGHSRERQTDRHGRQTDRDSRETEKRRRTETAVRQRQRTRTEIYIVIA